MSWATGVFVEPKSWEAIGLQVTALPWNLKGTTPFVSPLSSSLCICFILPANRLFLLLKTTWWNMATLNSWICIQESDRQISLALLAPIQNSWEKRSYWLSFARDSSSVPISYDQRRCSRSRSVGRDGLPSPAPINSGSSSQRRGKSLGTWQTLPKISAIIIFTNEAQHIFHHKWVFERIINAGFPWHAN